MWPTAVMEPRTCTCNVTLSFTTFSWNMALGHSRRTSPALATPTLRLQPRPGMTWPESGSLRVLRRVATDTLPESVVMAKGTTPASVTGPVEAAVAWQQEEGCGVGRGGGGSSHAGGAQVASTRALGARALQALAAPPTLGLRAARAQHVGPSPPRGPA
jgi:hypothetical protein